MEDFYLEIGMFALALGISIIPFFIKDPNKYWVKFAVCVVVCILVFFGIKNAYNKYKASEKTSKKQQETDAKLNQLLRSDSLAKENYNDIKTALERANIKYDSTSKMIFQNQVKYYGIRPRKIKESYIKEIINKASEGHAKDVGTDLKIRFSVYGSNSEDAEILSVKRQIIAIVQKLGYYNIVYDTLFFSYAPEPDAIICIYSSDNDGPYYNFVIPFAK